MKHLALITAIGFISYQLSDVRSGDVISGLIAPLLLVCAIVALMLWLKQKSLKRSHRVDQGEGPITISPGDFE